MEKRMQELLNVVNINKVQVNRVREVFGENHRITPEFVWALYMSDPSVYKSVTEAIIELAFKVGKKDA